jgi:hypothetical protein
MPFRLGASTTQIDPVSRLLNSKVIDELDSLNFNATYAEN